ncbi:Ubiquitin-like protein SMT3 [Penicillium argentinense]|uniref:Ubiquitin-like protein SMT3 n=1 Tax=Penicillium argentinense TaxID=1131581 RepID=A0A9W9JV72_9EURO|nr:Ubiquitin-like protein SMT3 [Penicillium argentinense]KAJ5082650.1 Ubiquitin-like protein SMT3 [Penicillium argentinense]
MPLDANVRRARLAQRRHVEALFANRELIEATMIATHELLKTSNTTQLPADIADTANMSAEQDGSAAPSEHLNIKVTDNNNEVFFKIKRSTQLKKLMDAFCDRQGKQMSTVRFLFDGTRVRPEDTPDTLDMADGDTLEVHQEQIGG